MIISLQSMVMTSYSGKQIALMASLVDVMAQHKA